MAELATLPSKGRLTFEAEGTNDPASPYFSRTAHVPSSSSGVTIGRGYDIKHRDKNEVYSDLLKAGVSEKESKLLSEGSKLVGDEAKEFIRKPEIKVITISEESQKILFESTYRIYFEDAKRICRKNDVSKKYGFCDWDAFSKQLQELVADLRYRGDYNPSTRLYLQQAIVSKDPIKLREAVKKIPGVPRDRKKKD